MGGRARANAHPHATDRVAVVHNGIIENFRELRNELQAEGAVFQSETDTEVVAHLVTRELEAGKDPVGAVQRPSAGCVEPSRSAFLFDGEENLIIGARLGSPAGDRLWRRRDVSRLGRHRPGAVHEHHLLSGGWRQRRADADSAKVFDKEHRPVERADPEDHGVGASWSTRPTTGTSWRRRSTSSPRSSRTRSHPSWTWPRARSGCRRRCPSRGRTSATDDLGLRNRILCRPGRQILVRALRADPGRGRYRLGVPLPRGAAGAGRPRDLRLAVRRDGRHAGSPALLQGARAAHPLGRQRARPRLSRGKATCSSRPSPARRSASPRPRPSRASSRRSSALRSAPGKARGILSAVDEERLVRGAHRGAAPDGRGPAAGA